MIYSPDIFMLLLGLEDKFNQKVFRFCYFLAPTERSHLTATLCDVYV